MIIEVKNKMCISMCCANACLSGICSLLGDIIFSFIEPMIQGVGGGILPI